LRLVRILSGAPFAFASLTSFCAQCRAAPYSTGSPTGVFSLKDSDQKPGPISILSGALFAFAGLPSLCVWAFNVCAIPLQLAVSFCLREMSAPPLAEERPVSYRRPRLRDCGPESDGRPGQARQRHSLRSS